MGMASNPDSSNDPNSAERIVAGLAKLSLVLRHERWWASGERGLTPTQSQILSIIASSHQPMGVGAVARQLAVTMGTASEAIGSLVDKGLIGKSRDPGDGRAIVLTLTEGGQREAHIAGVWPPAMLDAVASLPEPEQAGLLRGLVGVIRELQERGSVPTARMCVGCRFFRPNAHAGTPRPHHCAFVDAPIADTDLRLDCDDMESVPPEDAQRLWTLFVHGRKPPWHGAEAAAAHSQDPSIPTKETRP